MNTEVFTVSYPNPYPAKIRNRYFVRQHDKMDCGPACLATISEMYGRSVGLKVFRDLADVTGSGTSLFHLCKAAEEVGFQTLGISASFEKLRVLRPPFLVLMKNHFVVVLAVRDRNVVIMDPLFGKRILKQAEFEGEWSRTALLLYPAERFFHYPEYEPKYAKYFKLLTGYYQSFGFIFVLSLASFVVSLSFPLFNQFLFDNIIAHHKEQMLWVATLIAGAATVLSEAAEACLVYLRTHLSTRLEARFSALLMRVVSHLPLKFFSRRRVGDFLTRIEDVEKLRAYFTQMVLENALNLVKAGLFGAMILIYSHAVLEALLICLGVYSVIVLWITPHLKERVFEYSETMSKFKTFSLEQLRGIMTLRALNGTVPTLWRWRFMNIKTLGLKTRLLRGRTGVSALSQTMSEGISLIVLVVALREFSVGRLSAGQVICVTFLATRLLGPLVDLIEEFRDFGDASVSLGRVDDFFEEPSEDDTEKSIGPPDRMRGELEFQNVCFKYGGAHSPLILEDVSLRVRAGESALILGESGSGKSTLAALTNLLYSANSGTVRIDGIEIAKMPLDFLRTQVSLVSQDYHLVSATIGENIAGQELNSLDQVIAAAKLAEAHDFISALPLGYATPVGEIGQTLSGGQAQRVCIARAIYRNTPILIFDEATSGLDPVTEKRVLDRILGLKKTTLIISHRPGLAQAVDQVFQMDGGRLRADRQAG